VESSGRRLCLPRCLVWFIEDSERVCGCNIAARCNGGRGAFLLL